MWLPLFLRKLFIARRNMKWIGDEGVVFQKSMYGCGIACMHMAAIHYNRPLIEEQNVLATSKGISLLQISEALGAIGLHTKALEMNSPCILSSVWDQNPDLFIIVLLQGPRRNVLSPGLYHYVVLDSMALDGIVLRDPALGKVSLHRDTFCQLWSQYALFCSDPYAKSRVLDPLAERNFQRRKRVEECSGK